jgi:serine/threonine-protein kinase
MLVSDFTDGIKDAMSDRFAIDREIGRGGMATVYLAEETNPKRQVAVKVLEPELATTEARERFLREVEFSSQLTHPNIVPIFSSGEINGLLYYVMPYIDGHTLRYLLSTKGALDPDQAFQITAEVADALNYAHSKGVVHRDVKPENILLSNGHAVVADFGIARALCVACGDNLTIAGYPIGTPGYMSPEQGSGEEVDARTDVYSLGAVVYEMLSGEPPFKGPTIEAVIAARYTQPTPTLSGAGWNHSDTVDGAVQRAMMLDRDARFDSTMDFLRAMRSHVSADVMPDTLDPSRSLRPVVTKEARERSIAVLPFANLSPDPDNEYFADGITEDIITQLSKIGSLHVTSRTSVLPYRDTDKSLGRIAAELGVSTILEGSVRKAGNRVRVAAQLIDAEADSHLWADRYDRELTDIFEIQSEIAQHIADALQATLSPDEKELLGKKPTECLDAYNLHLQGRFYWSKFTPDGISRAIELFHEAAELDETFALPHAGIADSHILMTSTLGLTPPMKCMPLARESALKALQIAPDLADAHASLAAVKMWYDWDWEGARESFERALELEPDAEKPLMMYGFYLSAMGRHDEALAAARKGEALSPVSVLAATNVGTHLYKARRYDEAIAQFKKAQDVDVAFPPTYIMLGWTYLKTGEYDKAVQAAERAAYLTGGPPPRRAGLGCALAAAGETTRAAEIYAELEQLRVSEYVAATDLALLAAHLGKIDAAFGWLDEAIQERAGWLPYIKIDPIWDPLAPDPRLDDIARRIKLPGV